MHFDKLRLTGFKSFVDPTELVISKGLTGVIGPNGCGKSNLLEALRWVMGENRPTAMRGGGMEDVIFAGAASRPARNYAEVSLYIDNKTRHAPAGFNDADTLEVIRRITKDAGSAYKANGRDMRARDVQMLFADASTGAHSPSLVRQGQIAELINAKPKARRRVLEEAAGISGLYARRHDAELKLKAAETNLSRVEDVIEQLESQLRSLAKQAKQAMRYREIGEELRHAEGLLLYLRWRDADRAKQETEEDLRKIVMRASLAQKEASEALRNREKIDETLPPLREEQAIAAALFQRLSVESQGLGDQKRNAIAAIETLTARIAQLQEDRDREITLQRDADDMMTSLAKERDGISDASKDEEAKIEAASAAAREASSALQSQEAALDHENENLARLSARHQSLKGHIQDAEHLIAKHEAELSDASANKKDAEATLKATEEAHAHARKEDREAREAVEKSDRDLIMSEEARLEAQSREGEARAALSEAEGEATALAAEVAAVERLLARDLDKGDQLLDKLRVTPGYEAALGAALSDDLKAGEVTEGQTGWTALTPYAATDALPSSAELLSTYIRAPEVLSRRLSQIGLVDAADGQKLQESLRPGQRLVSKEGDLWRWDGFTMRASEGTNAAVLRLQQINRLEALQTREKDAAARLSAMKSAYDLAKEALNAASEADHMARRARKTADENLAAAARNLSETEAKLSMCEAKREASALNENRVREDLSQARDALQAAQASYDRLDNLDQIRAQIETRKIAVETARVEMLTKRSLADEMRREKELRVRRRDELTKEIGTWAARLETAKTRIDDFHRRFARAQSDLGEAKEKPAEIDAIRSTMAEKIAEAEKRRAAADDALAKAEAAFRETEMAARELERKAGETREERARAEAILEAAVRQIDEISARIREEMETTPADLLNGLDIDPEKLPDFDATERDVTRLRRQREALGAVNLRAEEDSLEISAERDALFSEKTELEEAIKKLRSGVFALNKEGRQRLLDAFDQVNQNFSMLFKTLFNGGDANLVLVESDDPLEAGLEIMCQPPGKKLTTISLLSGGEQTLTALSLIFAVFLANPSPICVLDEVDAPLDDANVNRFCDLLNEMTERTTTRFLIITHHAITMSRMDRLFGVTMQEQGVSQLVSVDLAAAERLVA